MVVLCDPSPVELVDAVSEAIARVPFVDLWRQHQQVTQGGQV